MEAKLFEVRDSGTFIPVICIKLVPTNEADRYLLSQSGYGKDIEQQANYLLYAELAGGMFEYEWGGHANRTRAVSHEYIQEHWDHLTSGDLIDVQFILGETSHKKPSQAVK